MDAPKKTILDLLLEPEVLTFLVGLLIAGAKILAQRLRLTRVSAELEKRTGSEAELARTLGVVVRGVHKTKGEIDPDAFLALINTIKAESLKHGTEKTLEPIVHETRATPDETPPDVVVRSATTRLDRPSGPSS